MAWLSETDLYSLPLRALIAVAARGARRVHRLGADDPEPLRSRSAAIGLAEFFAGGEPLMDALGEPLTSARVMEELGDSRSEALADRAARELGLAVYGATALSPSTDTVPEETRRHGRDSLELAQRAAADRSETDGERFGAAVTEDLRKLADLGPRLRAAEDDWLGAPVEPSELGLLGDLWAEGRKPSWYDSPQPITKGLSPQDDARAEEADIFCWQVDDDPTAVETILAKIKTAQEQAAILRERADPGISTARLPIFLVHARNLDEENIAKLILAGATILDDAAFEELRPASAAELAERVGQMIGNADQSTGAGWWRDDEFRYSWRHSQVEDHEAHPSEALRAAYEKIFIRSQPVDLSRQKGWPVGS